MSGTGKQRVLKSLFVGNRQWFKKSPVLVLLLILCAGVGVQAQTRTTKDGVFTEAQATTGQVTYDAKCKTCHDMKFYADIWESWQGKPLLDFWYFIVAEMPSQNPGSLGDGEYTEILAYILSQRGFPAGETPLDPRKGMDQITIALP